MQKLVGTELYVFDLTPFEITQQTGDATVIFVQNECIDGYKELNASLADKIKGFNQFAICVTDPWADGVEPGPEPPTPTTHTVTLSGTDLSSSVVEVHINMEQVEFANSYTVNDNEVLEIFLNEDPSCYELASANMNYSTEISPHYWINIASDLAVVLNYTAPTGHTIEVTNWEGVSGMRLTTELDSDAGEVNPQEFPVSNVEEGTYVKLWADNQSLETDQYYTITGAQATFVPASQSYNSYAFFYFVMPDEDVTLSVTYEEPTYAEVEVTYDVQNTESEIELFSAGGSSPYEGTPTPPDAMYVDDNQETVVNSWRFGTTGDHTVKFVFHSGRVSTGFMQVNQNAKSIKLNGQVTEIGENAFNSIQEPPFDSITSLAATPPILEGNDGTQFNNDVPIYVPADYVTAYQTAWTNYASQIQAMQS